MSFETMRLSFALLALVSNVAVIGWIILVLAGKFSGAAAAWRDEILDGVAGSELWLALGVATLATLGSLYLSEIVHLTPCRLCWWQRGVMYPLVIVLLAAAWRRLNGVGIPVGLVAVVGIAISSYHYLLQRYPSLDSGSCAADAPCSAAYIWEFNFVSIPYMAGSAFTLILVLMFALHLNNARMRLLT